MIYEDVQKISNAAVAKITLLKNHFGKYFIRAIMAGFFIAVAMIYNNVAGNLFEGSAPGKFIGALVFSIAVLLIVMVGGELFTGNNLVMAFGLLEGLGCELHRKFCWMFYSFTDLCRWRCFWHSRLLCRFYRWKIVHRSRSDVLQSSAL